MRHGSLFTGIGGFDLAAEWMGWENVFQVEIDPFCQKVLTKNFPNVTRYGDIKEFDGTKYRGTIDIISGGFPCQPFSVAGKQRGNSDDRYLWPEMLRVIREVKPAWVVGENVSGIIKLALDQVLSDLEGEGYSCQTFIIPACAVNAPHRRDRIWVIAYSTATGTRKQNREINNKGRETSKDRRDGLRQGDGEISTNGINSTDTVITDTQTPKCESSGTSWTGRDGFTNTNIVITNTESRESRIETEQEGWKDISGGDKFNSNSNNRRPQEPKQQTTGYKQFGRNVTDPDNKGLQRHGNNGECPSQRTFGKGTWEESWIEVATRLCNVDDGIPGRLVRPKGWRVNALKAGGNAIVPQVAFEIFKAIEQYETS